MEGWQVPALLAGGFVCGVTNALAGGGSFVTLPLLLWIGLPPQIANATNRVAIVLQCGTGIGAYHQHGVRPWKHVIALVAPSVAGALLGAYLAAKVDEAVFRHAAAILFLLMAGTVFINPNSWNRAEGKGHLRARLYPLFFLMGVYGGFLQAGIGVVLISTLVLLGGFDTVHGNALKFAITLVFTAASLVLFAGLGQVRWGIGLCLSAGTMAGGYVGARLVMTKGARWVRIFVLLGVAAGVVKLLW